MTLKVPDNQYGRLSYTKAATVLRPLFRPNRSR